MAPLFTNFRFGFGRDVSGAGVAANPFSGTGGEVSAGVSPGNGYTYHYWKTNGNFTVAPSYDTTGPGVDVLVVASGGSGGPRSGGGAGAGGIALGQNVPIPTATAGSAIPISVGSGPAIGPSGENPGISGNDSAFGASPNPYYVLGYRGAFGQSDGPSMEGGSGGGGHYNISGSEGIQPEKNPGKPWVTNYGNDGSIGGGAPAHNSGAGGGAGGAAQAGNQEGRGGAGNGQDLPNFSVPLYMPAPDPYRPGINPLPGNYYGGGGGAGSYPPVHPQNMPSAATYGGGGIGGPANTNGPGQSAIDGLGGGGGGSTAESFNPNTRGGAGGAGIVVLRYLA